MSSYRYDNVTCSQCGKDLGPGDHGVSSCHRHQMLQAERRVTGRRETDALQATAYQSLMGKKLAEQQRDMLLFELQAAHRIFPLLLAEMTSEQKFRLMRRGDLADVSPEGLTRYRERAAAIAMVTGSQR